MAATETMIRWLAWGRGAFDRPRREDKLILLDSGVHLLNTLETPKSTT
jgi:uncharacterized protein YyaL (SSP411 family)